jgi:hypothetical protein
MDALPFGARVIVRHHAGIRFAGVVASGPILSAGITGYRVRPAAGGPALWHSAARIEAVPPADLPRRYFAALHRLHGVDAAAILEAADELELLMDLAEGVNPVIHGRCRARLAELGVIAGGTEPRGAA